MKSPTLLLISSALLFSQSAHAISCAEIYERSKPKGKGTKAECVLVEHSPGVGRGTVDSVYSCKGTKYHLHVLEDFSCSVEGSKN